MKQKIAVLLAFLLIAVIPVWAQGSMSPQEIERISQSVVQIGAEQGGEIAWTGSGTIVSPTGLIYTNRHVTEGAEDYVIFMLEEDMNELPVAKYRARLVAQFSTMDFAILQIDRNANGGVVIPTSLDLPFLTPESNEVVRGEHIYVFGYPGIGNGYLVLTEGAITTAQNGTIGGERMVVWYQTDAEIAPGNSGGLAVTGTGELVGIPTAVDSEDRTAGRLGGLLPFRAVMALAESGEDIVAAPTPGTTSQGSGTASTEITNIEHNIEQNGEPGMIVHTYMRIAGYKDVPVVAAIYFYDTSDALVEASELAGDEFVASNGLLRAVADLNPGFDDTEYTDLTFWVPYNAFPLGLSGDVSFFAEADIFDGENWIAPSEKFELILMYDDSTTDTNQNSQSAVSVPGVTASCGNITITNGVEIIVRQMRPGFNYTATAVGIGGFDPVLIVRDTTNINDMLCNDDETSAAKFQMNLPSTGNVGASSTSSQVVFNHSNASMTDISLIVGSFDGSPGEFVLVLEGMAVTREDGAGDPFTLNGTSSMANSSTPLSVYMIGTERQLDPYFSVVDYPNLDIWTDTDDLQIYCDDAGDSDICWDTTGSLNGFQISRGSRGIVTADAQDAMLRLPIQQLDPQPMTFLMSSYNRSTTGLYMIAFHIGLG
jgi:S1-C subfamily serine protease